MKKSWKILFVFFLRKERNTKEGLHFHFNLMEVERNHFVI